MLVTFQMRMDLWFWLSSILLHPVGHYVLDGGSIFYCRRKWGTKHLHCFKLMSVRKSDFSAQQKAAFCVFQCVLPMLHSWPHWPSLTAHTGTFTAFPLKIQSTSSWVWQTTILCALKETCWPANYHTSPVSCFSIMLITFLHFYSR